MPQGIVIGQRLASVKIDRAKQLRRQMIPEEALLWILGSHLRTNKLGSLHFRRQQVIAGFIADFHCHAQGLIIEVDGSIHEQQTEYDAARDEMLSQHGLRILRIRNEDIQHHLEDILTRIAAACGITYPPSIER